MLWKGRTSSAGDKGELTPFNALMTALAGTIGTGSIVGVATAILSGGPGALFWMWCTAMVGMATKFSEILLAVRYREVTPAGNFVGGAMYFIKNGLGEKWKWLGGLFAIFAAITCFGTGNAVQTNAISGVLWGTFGVPTWITALILFLLIASVLLGGLRRIGSVAGKIVPFMAILYTLASLLIIILNIKEVPAMFLHVIEEAFTPTAAQGGFAGATAMMAVRFGMARGIFANEAGLGSGPIAHATATSTPIRQATIGMLDVFITTMIVCSMTGFAILVTGEWTAVGAQGASLTARAFETALPGVGSAIVAISLVMFAFTTILGWCVYGERSAIFLFGDRVLKPFRIPLHHRRAHRRSGPARSGLDSCRHLQRADGFPQPHRRAPAEPCGVQNRTREHTALKRARARTFTVLIPIRLYLGIVTIFRSSPFSVIPIDGKALYRYLTANFRHRC